jgi:hypothetical protein
MIRDRHFYRNGSRIYVYGTTEGTWLRKRGKSDMFWEYIPKISNSKDETIGTKNMIVLRNKTDSKTIFILQEVQIGFWSQKKS